MITADDFKKKIELEVPKQVESLVEFKLSKILYSKKIKISNHICFSIPLEQYEWKDYIIDELEKRGFKNINFYFCENNGDCRPHYDVWFSLK